MRQETYNPKVVQPDGGLCGTSVDQPKMFSEISHKPTESPFNLYLAALMLPM